MMLLAIAPIMAIISANNAQIAANSARLSTQIAMQSAQQSAYYQRHRQEEEARNKEGLDHVHYFSGAASGGKTLDCSKKVQPDCNYTEYWAPDDPIRNYGAKFRIVEPTHAELAPDPWWRDRDLQRAIMGWGVIALIGLTLLAAFLGVVRLTVLAFWGK